MLDSHVGIIGKHPLYFIYDNFQQYLMIIRYSNINKYYFFSANGCTLVYLNYFIYYLYYLFQIMIFVLDFWTHPILLKY